jgi:hypothetical protein
LGAAGTFFLLAFNINVTWKRIFALVFFVLAIDRAVVKIVADGIKKREAERAADEKAKVQKL